MIALIACMDAHRLIGLDGRLPWHLPADLAHFLALTMGRVVVMGRKTWESLPAPLEGRKLTVVLSREERDWKTPRVMAGSDVRYACLFDRDCDVFVIGGAQVFAEAMPLADRLYLTRIDHVFPTEGREAVYFPEWPGFRQTDAVPRFADEKNAYNLSFQVWERA